MIQNDNIVFNRKEAAKYLGISLWTLDQETREGKIPHIRIARRVLYRKATLDSWMDQKEKESLNVCTIQGNLAKLKGVLGR